MIHPTAIIHPRAQIGADCEIGPYCTIGEHVVLGPRCRLVSHVVVDGHTTLGQDNHIYPFVSLGLRTQDLKWKGGITRLTIGDHNTIRECVTVHSATTDGDATVIGSHNNILASSHIGHDVVMGDHVIVSMAAIAGHVVVEDHALVGGLAAVHQFCRIGKMAMIAGCTKVVQDIAPFMIVDGNPAETRTINKVGLERNGVNEQSQSAIKQAFKIIFREGLSVPNALARVETELPGSPEIQHLLTFMRSSQRGVTK
jgi:UDP-N-acetylglucosamine acyltransferase